MEPLNDNELRELLRRWEAPPAPAHVTSKIFGARLPWYRWLLSGSIRVPVPAVAALLVVLGLIASMTQSASQPPAVSELRVSDFQPVPELKLRVIRSDHAND
jgi:hypothetical protein